MTIYFELEGVLIKKQKEPEWMPGSQLIYDRLVSFADRVGWKVKILAKYYSEIDKKNKTRWIKENLKLTNKSIRLVSDQKYKINFAEPLSLLLDDSQDRIYSFIYSGGMGILYDGLASTVKKVEYFLEAMEELYKEKPDKIDDASEIIKSRLACLLRKLELDNWKNEYGYCLNLIYKWGCEYYMELWNNYETVYGDVKQEDAPDAFYTVAYLFFEQEAMAAKIAAEEESRKTEAKKNSNELTELQPFSLEVEDLKYDNKWEEKLMKYYFDDKKNPIYSMHIDKAIFDKVGWHIAKVHKISHIACLYECEAVSVLMFVYINLLLEFIQKELAAEAAS